MRKRIQRPSPALVVACIALFVSLGGVGYAAATIGTSDIKNGAVTGKKIKDRTITAKDINPNTVTALKGANGTPGAPGAQGPQGPQGPQGASATKLFATINGNGTRVTAKESGVVSADKSGAGTYLVYFNRSLLDCTYVATASNQIDAPENVQVGVQGIPATDLDGDLEDNGVFVQTADSSGTLTDSGFNLIVVCP